MATITVSVSQPGSVPIASLAGATRSAGGATSTTLLIGGGPGTVTLTGTGFTYDLLALPATGTVTALTFRADGVAVTWTVTGISVGAALLRSNEATLDTFLFGFGDSAVGASGADLINGYGGADTLLGNAGGDSLLGGNGNDSLVGGAGDDSLVGSFGNDTLVGGLDNDTLVGGDGQDSLVGGGGVESILGGNGNDTASASSGVVDLGAGDDVLRGNFDANLVAEGGGGDDVVLTGTGTFLATLSGFEILQWIDPAVFLRVTTAQIDAFTTLRRTEADPVGLGGLQLVGGGVVDLGGLVYDFQAGDLFTVQLRDGTWDLRGRDSAVGFADDLIRTSTAAANDTIQTFGGNDEIISFAGNDSILAGEGNDEVAIGAGNAIVFLGGGNDTLSLATQPAVSGANTVDGGAGDDIITGLAGNDSLLGGTGNDSITGDSTFLTGAGNDRIFGGAGNDTLLGGGGGDLIRGGTGADRTSGGTGADTFAFDDGESGILSGSVLSGADTITDFNRLSGDKFDLSLIDANTAMLGDQAFSQLLAASSQTAVGAGSLRYQTGIGATTISGSTDADADFEFRIIVLTTTTYTPLLSDFIL